MGKILNKDIGRFILVTLSANLFQIATLICVMFIQLMLWLNTGILFSQHTGTRDLINIITTVIAYGLGVIFYGIVWYYYWYFLYKETIRWFYYRVIFSILPLILYLRIFQPVPTNQLVMITHDMKPLFSCVVTGILVLPVYSILLYKYVIPKVKRKKSFVYVVIFTLVIGSLVFMTSYMMMDTLYNIP